MNEEFLQTGRLESKTGVLVWPGMDGGDVSHLVPEPAERNRSGTRYQIDETWLAATKFKGVVVIPKNQHDAKVKVFLWMDPATSEERFGKKFALQEEQQFYQDILRQSYGTVKAKYKLDWGAVSIGIDAKTLDPSIVAIYE